MKKYVVRLTEEERSTLTALVKKNGVAIRKQTHAQVLLKIDEGEDGPRWTDLEAAAAYNVHFNTVRVIRQRLVEEGMQAALERKKQARPSRQRKLEESGERELLAIAQGAAPDGRARWTLQLLADRLVQLEVVESICLETVRRSLKKNDLKPHVQVGWVIPPEHDGEYVACMEDVLDLYQRPHDPAAPVVCMDEQPVQLVQEIRTPIPAAPGRPERVDYEYERAGTANIFVFTEPKTSWRHVHATEHRTKVDWALEVRALLDGRYAGVPKVVLVLDNLNTHTLGSLYQAFPPAEAYRLAQRLELHHTPKHGSWLNIAENELSALTTQCLSRRIGTLEELQRQIGAWENSRNEERVRVNWRFTIDRAREKLKRIYPQILK